MGKQLTFFARAFGYCRATKSMILFMFLANGVHAEAPLTGPEFDAYVTGRTLAYGLDGTANFGVETYLPGRRVIWSAAPGSCTNGIWYASKGDICFRYDGDPDPKCWAVYAEDDGLRAVYTSQPNTTVLFESVTDVPPLICGDLSS